MKGKIALALCILVFLGVFSALPVTFAFTPPPGWNSYVEVALTETAGVDRVEEPVDVQFAPAFGTCQNESEIRVIAPDGVTEIPSQVYDVVTSGGYITSCRVVFLASCPALSSVTYYIIYNNPSATPPVYDGLRLNTIEEGDTYNVTALVDSVEKNYTRIWWKSSAELYSDGELICWSGGLPGGLSNQINWASFWDGLRWNGTGNEVGVVWGWNKTLSVLNSGPLFVDFNYTEAGGTPQFLADPWLFDYNVTTTSIIRIYYQPNLNPLVRFHKTFTIKTNLANYTIGGGAYLDFRLADSTSLHPIYKFFTWKNTTGHVNTIEVNRMRAHSADIWTPGSPVGWWKFSGPHVESADLPEANIGYVPTYTNTTILGVNYGLTAEESVFQDDNKCGQWFEGSFNGVYGDTFEIEAYIVVSKEDGDVDFNGIVNILDILVQAVAFGTEPGDQKWDARADVDGNGIINILDILKVAVNFGNEYMTMEDRVSQLRNPINS